MKLLKFRIWDGNKMTYMTMQELIDSQLKLTNKHKVMQFTCLRDKYHKDIYEGDIIEEEGVLTILKYRTPSFVMLHREPFMPSHDSNKVDWELWPTWSGSIEVVGNIFENKELLQPAS